MPSNNQNQIAKSGRSGNTLATASRIERSTEEGYCRHFEAPTNESFLGHFVDDVTGHGTRSATGER